jgi:hypothetical protein
MAAESVPPRCRQKKADPPRGDPHPPGTPPFREMGPTSTDELESARTIQNFLEPCQESETVGDISAASMVLGLCCRAFT